jgi:hypothetical protein
MRRSYRSERLLAILSRVRDQIPDAAITTDIIVGFPTETEADLAETLRVVEASRFSGAFTFQYSRAPAAGLPPRPREVVQERYERLVARRHLALRAGRRQHAPPSHPALIPPPRTSPPRASPASAHAAMNARTWLPSVAGGCQGRGLGRRSGCAGAGRRQDRSSGGALRLDPSGAPAQ